jgi:hypothetical protein
MMPLDAAQSAIILRDFGVTVVNDGRPKSGHPMAKAVQKLARMAVFNRYRHVASYDEVGPEPEEFVRNRAAKHGCFSMLQARDAARHNRGIIALNTYAPSAKCEDVLNSLQLANHRGVHSCGINALYCESKSTFIFSDCALFGESIKSIFKMMLRRNCLTLVCTMLVRKEMTEGGFECPDYNVRGTIVKDRVVIWLGDGSKYDHDLSGAETWFKPGTYCEGDKTLSWEYETCGPITTFYFNMSNQITSSRTVEDVSGTKGFASVFGPLVTAMCGKKKIFVENTIWRRIFFKVLNATNTTVVLAHARNMQSQITLNGTITTNEVKLQAEIAATICISAWYLARIEKAAFDIAARRIDELIASADQASNSLLSSVVHRFKKWWNDLLGGDVVSQIERFKKNIGPALVIAEIDEYVMECDEHVVVTVRDHDKFEELIATVGAPDIFTYVNPPTQLDHEPRDWYRDRTISLHRAGVLPEERKAMATRFGVPTGCLKACQLFDAFIDDLRKENEALNGAIRAAALTATTPELYARVGPNSVAEYLSETDRKKFITEFNSRWTPKDEMRSRFEGGNEIARARVALASLVNVKIERTALCIGEWPCGFADYLHYLGFKTDVSTLLDPVRTEESSAKHNITVEDARDIEAIDEEYAFVTCDIDSAQNEEAVMHVLDLIAPTRVRAMIKINSPSPTMIKKLCDVALTRPFKILANKGIASKGSAERYVYFGSELIANLPIAVETALFRYFGYRPCLMKEELAPDSVDDHPLVYDVDSFRSGRDIFLTNHNSALARYTNRVRFSDDGVWKVSGPRAFIKAEPSTPLKPPVVAGVVKTIEEKRNTILQRLPTLQTHRDLTADDYMLHRAYRSLASGSTSVASDLVRLARSVWDVVPDIIPGKLERRRDRLIRDSGYRHIPLDGSGA